MNRRRRTVAIVAALLPWIGRAQAAGGDAVKVFHDAVAMGDTDLVRRLLERDQSLAVSKDRFGFQPIHLMDMYFEPAILGLLLAAGADVNATNDEGVTILHLITDPEAVGTLVARGAKIEARDRRGWTPLLMQANERDREEVVGALLALGADPNARGDAGETALSFARERGHADLVGRLMRAGAKD